ncbi:MAG: TraX family protein, partial [Clostridiales bacterium]
FRLVLFAIIFQKPYCYCTNLTDINIFGELALGLIAIYAYEQLFKQQRPLLAWLPALIFGIMAQLWNFQYGLYGIALLITGYVFADQQWKLSAAWLFINSIPLWGLLDMGNSQILSLLALPLIFVYNGNRGRGNKWLFYGFYCLHIPALWLINIYLH